MLFSNPSSYVQLVVVLLTCCFIQIPEKVFYLYVVAFSRFPDGFTFSSGAVPTIHVITKEYCFQCWVQLQYMAD
jgi:hypothetical protein